MFHHNNTNGKINLIFSSHLWVALSSMYGKILVLLMVAFCLTEVLDNKIRPLAFQVKIGLFYYWIYWSYKKTLQVNYKMIDTHTFCCVFFD